MKDEKKLKQNLDNKENCCCDSKKDEQTKERRCHSDKEEKYTDKPYNESTRYEFGRESDVNPFVLTKTINNQTNR